VAEKGGRKVKKVQIMYTHTHTHININAKMTSVETIPGIGGGRDEGDQWGHEFKYDVIDIL
jgi:hypothetical protein